MSTTPLPLYNPDVTRCDFYLPKKMRFCKTEKVAIPVGQVCSSTSVHDSTASPLLIPRRFCHTHTMDIAMDTTSSHQTNSDNHGDKKNDDNNNINNSSMNVNSGKGPRVPCFINPNHSIYQKDIKKHSKVCPDLRWQADTHCFFYKNLHAFNSHKDIIVTRACGTAQGCEEIKTRIGTCDNDTVNVSDNIPHNGFSCSLRVTNPINPSQLEDVEIKGEIVTGSKRDRRMYDPNDLSTKAYMSTAPSVTPTSTRFTHRNLSEDALLALISKVVLYYKQEVAHNIVQRHHIVATYSDKLDHNDCLNSTNDLEPSDGVFSGRYPLNCEGNERKDCINNNNINSKNIEDETTHPRQQNKKGINKKHTPQHEALLALIEDLIPPPQQQQKRSIHNKDGAILLRENDILRNTNDISADPDQLWCVELGAGKGGLALAVHSAAMQRVSSSSTPPQTASTTSMFITHVLVADIGGFRRKADGCVRNEKQIPFHRIRINVKDLNLYRAIRYCSDGYLPVTPHPAKLISAKNSTMGEKHDIDTCIDDNTGKNKQFLNSSTLQNRDIIPFLAVGKHLCGACTDFALSSCFIGISNDKKGTSKISNTVPPTDRSNTSVEEERISTAFLRQGCKGIVIATCCHHRCEEQHFNTLSVYTSITTKLTSITPLAMADTSELCSNGGVAIDNSAAANITVDTPPPPLFLGHFTPQETAAIISMTSWGISSIDGDMHVKSSDGNSIECISRTSIGYYCKRLIDWHRCLYIKKMMSMRLIVGSDVKQHNTSCKTVDSTEHQYDVKLVEYCSSDVTPENIAIVMSPIRT